MINTFEIYQNLKETFGEKEATVLTNLLVKIYNELNQAVTKEEFRVLTEKVEELAEAQKRTEQRVEELAEAQKRTEQRVEELAEAQKRTEQRVEELAEAQKRTEQRVEELAEAQKRTEQRVEELAEAQKRTEQRVEELAEAQKRTEQRVDELTVHMKELSEAQKKTEEVLKNLIITVDDLKKQVGGLSMVVGYGIEDNLMPYIENFVYNQYGAKSQEIERKYIQYENGNYDEVNIYVKAVKNNKNVYIIGECKAQPGKRDIDRFAKMLDRLRDHFQSDVYGFVVGYTFHPEIEDYCKKHYNISIYKTYQIKRFSQKKVRSQK